MFYTYIFKNDKHNILIMSCWTLYIIIIFMSHVIKSQNVSEWIMKNFLNYVMKMKEKIIHEIRI